MPIDLETFKAAYAKWVEESLPDFQAGKVQEVVKRYPLIVSEGVPWTPYKGSPSEQTIALVTSGGLYLKDRQPNGWPKSNPRGHCGSNSAGAACPGNRGMWNANGAS